MYDELKEVYTTGIDEFKEEVIKWLCPGKTLAEFFKGMPHLSCDKAWDNVMNIAIHCKECGTKSGSCICLKCFLNGNHEGHHITVNPSAHANCDCGNETFWKSSGYCSHHIGRTIDSDIEFIPESSRNILNTVCKILVNDLEQQLKFNDEEQAIKILDYLTELTKYGDPIRRVVTRSIETYSSYRILLSGITAYGEFLLSILIEFLGGCLTDKSFIENASSDFYYEFPKLLESVVVNPNPENFNVQPYVGFKTMIEFCFHFFNTETFLKTAKSDPNFVQTYTKVTKTLIENMNRNGYTFYRKTRIGSITQYIAKMISSLAKDPSMKEKLLELSRNIIISICQNDALYYYFTIEVDEKIDAYSTIEAFTSLTSNTIALIVESIGKNGLLPNDFFDIYSFMISESDLIVEDELGSSVLHPLTRITFCTSMHQALAYYLSGFGEEMRLKYQEVVKAKGYEPNLLSLHIARHPLRLIAASWLAQEDLFVRNPNPTISALYTLSAGTFRVRKFCSLFALVQFMAGITEDKDGFVKMAAGIFGTDKEEEKTVLVFLYFILNVVLNRTFIPPTMKNYVLSSLSNLMRNGPRPAKDFLDIEWRKNKLFEILGRIAENDGSDVWKLKSREYIEAVNPWDRLQSFFNFVTEENEKGNVPFSIKQFKEIPRLSVSGILMSAELTPFIIKGLNMSNTVTNQIAMNLISLRLQVDPSSLTEEVISAVKCEQFLKKIGVSKEVQTQSDEKQNREDVKKSVIDKFNSMLSSFSFDGESEEEEEEEEDVYDHEMVCSICGQNTPAPYGYPAIIVTSPLPDLLEDLAYLEVAPMLICCQHAVHLGCSQCTIESCPVCRVVRHFYIPEVYNVPDEDLNKKEYKEAIERLLFVFASFEILAPQVAAAKAINTLIATLELRAREKPQILNQESYKIIVRNIVSLIGRVFDPIDPDNCDCGMVMAAAYSWPDGLNTYLCEINNLVIRRKATILSYLCGKDMDIVDELSKLKGKLTPFEFIPLKPSLLHYYITDNDEEIAFNDQHAYLILSGQLVPLDFLTFGQIESPFEAIMPINGHTAGSVYLYYKRLRIRQRFVGLYTDENGNEDIGFSHHSYVRLNQGKLRELVDLILSCEWISTDQEPNLF